METECWYHEACAHGVINGTLLAKAQTGGQSAAGPISVFWMYASKVEECDHCSKPIKLGERAFRVRIAEPNGHRSGQLTRLADNTEK